MKTNLGKFDPETFGYANNHPHPLLRHFLMHSVSYSGRDWDDSPEQRLLEKKHGIHTTSIHYAQDLLNFSVSKSHAMDEARVASLLSLALKRFRNRHVSKAWEEWQFKYEQIKHQRFIVAGAMRRMIHRKLSMAWEQWQFIYAEWLAQKNLLMNAMKKFLHRQLFRAWNMWRDWAAEMRRQAYALNGALTRMRNRQLSMAFEKWQYEAEKAKHEKFILGGALKRMQNFQLSRAWERWQFVAEEARYQKELLRKGLMKMIKQKLAMALTRWLFWYDELMHQKAKLRNALLRMQNRLLATAFYTWESKLAKYYLAPPSPLLEPVVPDPTPVEPRVRIARYTPVKHVPKIIQPLGAETRLGYRLGEVPVPLERRGLNDPRAVLVSQYYAPRR